MRQRELLRPNVWRPGSTQSAESQSVLVRDVLVKHRVIVGISKRIASQNASRQRQKAFCDGIYIEICSSKNLQTDVLAQQQASKKACTGMAIKTTSVCSMEPKVFLRRFFDKIHSKISTISRIGTEVSLKIKIILKNQLQISEKSISKLKCCVDILWGINSNIS